MTSLNAESLPKHVAIIMDGNNRFAKKKQLLKGAGHHEGKNNLDPIVEHCRSKNIQALTVFAFSSENWNRPQFEVDLLMQLLEQSIHDQLPRMLKFGIAMRFIGDRSRLSNQLQSLMQSAEEKTAHLKNMTLSIAVSYGGMWDVMQAAKKIALEFKTDTIELDQVDQNYFNKYMSLGDLPAVDLLIRTGGDFRLSNFLLWQAAYAELYFTDTLWPEFSVAEFDVALETFASRERRFGKTSEQVQQNKLLENGQ